MIQSIRTAALLGSAMFLAACASTGSNDYSDTASGLGAENAALVIFGAKVIGRDSIGNSRLGGVSMTFRNQATSEKTKNISGVWGYPKETIFAMWLTPGTYELSDVFFFNGAMQPVKSTPTVTVAAGEKLYLGTISTTWGFAEEAMVNAKPLAKFDYTRRELCVLGGECDTEGTVLLYDDSERALAELAETYPGIRTEEIENRFLRPK